MFPPKHSTSRWTPELSGKVMVLDTMLAILKATTTDKIVLVSNYTQVHIGQCCAHELTCGPSPSLRFYPSSCQTLDLFELMCKTRGYHFVRLDGSMGISKRQTLVDRFNDPAVC